MRKSISCMLSLGAVLLGVAGCSIHKQETRSADWSNDALEYHTVETSDGLFSIDVPDVFDGIITNRVTAGVLHFYPPQSVRKDYRGPGPYVELLVSAEEVKKGTKRYLKSITVDGNHEVLTYEGPLANLGRSWARKHIGSIQLKSGLTLTIEAADPEPSRFFSPESVLKMLKSASVTAVQPETSKTNLIFRSAAFTTITEDE